jgi:hypothetical protein
LSDKKQLEIDNLKNLVGQNCEKSPSSPCPARNPAVGQNALMSVGQNSQKTASSPCGTRLPVVGQDNWKLTVLNNLF